jgi:hypothetical protein
MPLYLVVFAATTAIFQPTFGPSAAGSAGGVLFAFMVLVLLLRFAPCCASFGLGRGSSSGSGSTEPTNELPSYASIFSSWL